MTRHEMKEEIERLTDRVMWLKMDLQKCAVERLAQARGCRTREAEALLEAAVPAEGVVCPVCGSKGLAFGMHGLVGTTSRGECMNGRGVTQLAATGPPCRWRGTPIVKGVDDILAFMPISTHTYPEAENAQ